MNESRNWRLVLGGLALATLAAMSYAAGGTVRVGGGAPDGDYRTFAEATCEVLKYRLFTCTAVVTQGSVDNDRRLNLPLTDPEAVDIAILQGDVAGTSQQQPGFHDRFVFVRNIAGEAVLLVMTPETAAAVTNWVGVKEAARRLSLGLPCKGSGDSATFVAVRKLLYPQLEGLEVMQCPDRSEHAERLKLIDAVKSGAVDIGWLVQYPNPDNGVFRAIAAQGMVVMGVVEPDLAQPGGPFGVQDVTVAQRCWLGICWAPKTVRTTTLKAAIVARAAATYPDPRSRDIQNSAIHAIQQAKESDLLPRPAWFTARFTGLTALFAWLGTLVMLLGALFM